MVYKYCENENFEDLACGRVLLHRTGYPNFPVRLAQEIFGRCLAYLDSPGRVSLYDPCCGGGYLLAILGFLNYEKISFLTGSDINPQALELADENLSLLQKEGLARRTRQLDRLLALHNKSSHKEALESAARLSGIVAGASREIGHRLFQADILSPSPLANQKFQADVVFADVPYGNLAVWQGQGGEGVNFLDQLLPVLKENAVVAVCADKSQKFMSGRFQRLEKQSVGKRVFWIFRAKS